MFRSGSSDVASRWGQTRNISIREPAMLHTRSTISVSLSQHLIKTHTHTLTHSMRNVYDSQKLIENLLNKHSIQKDTIFDTDGNIYEVLLMFYDPPEGDHLINRAVKSFDGPFSHVELVFPCHRKKTQLVVSGQNYQMKQIESNTRLLYGSSIFQNGTVFFHEKEYQREGYTSIGLRINKNMHDALVFFCQDASARGVKFDYLGMARACLPIVLMPHDPSLTFCSKFVTDALQYAGIEEVTELESRMTTPSALYRHVRTKLRAYSIVTASPAKLRQFHVHTKPTVSRIRL